MKCIEYKKKQYKFINREAINNFVYENPEVFDFIINDQTKDHTNLIDEKYERFLKDDKEFIYADSVNKKNEELIEEADIVFNLGTLTQETRRKKAGDKSVSLSLLSGKTLEENEDFIFNNLLKKLLYRRPKGDNVRKTEVHIHFNKTNATAVSKKTIDQTTEILKNIKKRIEKEGYSIKFVTTIDTKSETSENYSKLDIIYASELAGNSDTQLYKYVPNINLKSNYFIQIKSDKNLDIIEQTLKLREDKKGRFPKEMEQKRIIKENTSKRGLASKNLEKNNIISINFQDGNSYLGEAQYVVKKVKDTETEEGIVRTVKLELLEEDQKLKMYNIARKRRFEKKEEAVKKKKVSKKKENNNQPTITPNNNGVLKADGKNVIFFSTNKPYEPRDITNILTLKKANKLTKEMKEFISELQQATEISVPTEYISQVKELLGIKQFNPETLKELESNAAAVIKSKKGDDKYIYLKGTIDVNQLNPDDKNRTRIKGKNYNGIEIVADYYSHKTIKDATGNDEADILIVDSLEDAQEQYDNYIEGGAKQFTSIKFKKYEKQSLDVELDNSQDQDEDTETTDSSSYEIAQKMLNAGLNPLNNNKSKGEIRAIFVDDSSEDENFNSNEDSDNNNSDDDYPPFSLENISETPSKASDFQSIKALTDKIQKLNPDIKVEFVTDQDLLNMGLPQNKYIKAFVDGGDTIYINIDRASTTDTLEELAHIWLSFIKQDNPPLYYEMVQQAMQDPSKENIREKVKKAYGDVYNDDNMLGEEILAKLMADVSENNMNQETEQRQGFLSKFKKFFRSIFNKVRKSLEKLFGGSIIDDTDFLNKRLNDFIYEYGSKIMVNRLAYTSRESLRVYSMENTPKEQNLQEMLFKLDEKAKKTSLSKDEKSYLFDNKEYDRATAFLKNEKVAQKLNVSSFLFNIDDWEKNKVANIKQSTYSEQRKKELIKDVKREKKYISSIASELGTELHFVMESVFKNQDISNTMTALKDQMNFNYNDLQAFVKLAFEFKENVLAKYKNMDYEVRLEQPLLTDKVKNLKDIPTKRVAGTGDLLIFYKKEGKVYVDTYDYKFSNKPSDQWDKDKMIGIQYQQALYRMMLRDMGFNIGESYIVEGLVSHNDYKTVEEGKEDQASEYTIEKIDNFNIKTLDTSIEEQKLTNIFDINPTKFRLSLNELKDNQIFSAINMLFEYDIEEKGLEGNENLKEVAKNILSKKKFESEEEEEKEINKVLASLKRKQEARSNLSRSFGIFFNELQNYNRRVVESSESMVSLSRPKWKGQKGMKSDNVEELLKKYTNQYKVNEDGSIDHIYELLFNPGDKEFGLLETFDLLAVRNKYTKEIDFISLHESELNQYAGKDPLSRFSEKIAENKSLLGLFGTERTFEGLDLPKATESQAGLIKAGIYAYFIKNQLEDHTIKDIISFSIVGRSNQIVKGTRVFEDIKKIFLGQNNIGVRNLKDFATNHKMSFDKFDIRLTDENYTDNLMTMIELLLNNPSYSTDASKKMSLQSFKDTLEEILESESVPFEEKLYNIKQEVIKRFNRLSMIESASNIIPGQGGVNYGRSSNKDEIYLLSDFIEDISNIRINASEDISGSRVTLGESLLFTMPEDMRNEYSRTFVSLYQHASKRIASRFSEYYTTKESGLRDIIKEYTDKKLNYVEKNLIGNREKIFKNLFEYVKTPDGKWKNTFRLRDPELYDIGADFQTDLKDEDRVFIRKFLEKINQTRGKELDVTSKAYREVPLMRGSTYSKLTQGIGNKNTKSTLKKAIDEYFNDFTNTLDVLEKDDDAKARYVSRIEMVDMFAYQENEENRISLLEESSDEDFENDLEAIGMMYGFNSIRKEEYNNILSVMNAIRAKMTINATGVYKQYPNIEKILNQYIKQAIYNRPGVTDDDELNNKISQPLKSFTTSLSIGLAPSTALINVLTNFYNTVNAVNGIYRDKFDKGTLRKSMMFVLKEMPKTTESINFLNTAAQEFGLVDMESSKMINNLKENRFGVVHFDKWLHFLNSYPDFIFRMMLFFAEAQTNGTIDIKNGKISADSAITYNKEKETIDYNPKKDKRFKVLYDGRTSKDSDNYKKAKALYDHMKSELDKEYKGLTDSGEIAKPYTQKELFSKHKAADLIYQETSPENKIWLERTALGSLALMFKKWVLSKKNIYFMKYQNHEAMGKYETVEYLDENGEKQYQVIWKGRPMEGILYSLFNYLKDIKELKNPVTAFKQLEEFRKNNIRHIAMDLMTWAATLFAYQLFEDEEKKGDVDQWLLRLFYFSGKDMAIWNLILGLLKLNNSIVSINYVDTFVTDIINNILEPQKAAYETAKNIGFTKFPTEILIDRDDIYG